MISTFNKNKFHVYCQLFSLTFFRCELLVSRSDYTKRLIKATACSVYMLEVQHAALNYLKVEFPMLKRCI